MSQKLSIPEISYSAILSRREPEEFVARKRELDEVLRHARSGANGANSAGRGLLVLSAPAEGVSELLRQAYDQLFHEQGDVVPFYFAFGHSGRSVESAATRFLQTFLAQVVAFRRGDPHMLDSSPEISELAELAAPEDGHWIDRLIAACETDSLLADERSFVRQCLSAPLRAAAGGAKCVMLIDDLHHAEDLAGSTSFTAELYDIFSRSSIPFVLAGRRRFLLPSTQEGEARLSDTSILNLSKLSETDAGTLVEMLAAETAVGINEQTRDLLIQQFDSSPGYLRLFFEAASDDKTSLDSFQNCQQLYTKEILGGRLHRYLDSLLDEITGKPEVQRNLIDVLHESLENQAHATQIEFWRKRIEASDEDFNKLMQGMHLQEFIRLNASVVELTDETSVSRDYIDARYRLEVKAEPRALVTAETLATFLKRAPYIMTRYYRRYAALALRELLTFFNCQPVPQALFDYQDFRDKYKGLEDERINAGLAEEEDKLRLPQIVYTASCVAIYPPIKQVLEEERCSVAFGFDNGKYADENEVVWIAAELDSKMEASRELTEFWCDRLEMMALMCNFTRHRIWLITPEGFDAEAATVLRNRRAYGSSRQQVELLMDQLNAAGLTAKTKAKNNEYEMIVPMGDDTEMISAHAVEEIARRHHFKQAAINQIKTALVEACINAAEHSLSPDRKIHQKFVVEDDRIIITVSNRGISLPAVRAAAAASELDEESRRGWGLKLIRNLMDEVSFEQVDDGTKITMVKYLVS